MSKVSPDPQLGYDDTVAELKRTLAAVLRSHAQLLNALVEHYTITAVTAATHTEIATEGSALLLCDATAANITVNLPSAAGNRARIDIKKMDATANTVTIEGLGAETIDGAANKVISVQYASYTLMSDNANWVVV